MTNTGFECILVPNYGLQKKKKYHQSYFQFNFNKVVKKYIIVY